MDGIESLYKAFGELADAKDKIGEVLSLQVARVAGSSQDGGRLC